MIAYLVLFIISVVSIYCLPRSSFVKDTGLQNNSLHFLITLKIFVSICFAAFLLHTGKSPDYSWANFLGKEEYKRIFTDPIGFFTDFGQHNYATTGDFLSAENSAWDDFSMNLISKILAVFNFFTRGNFVLNSVLFSIFGFLGSVGLYRFFIIGKTKNIPALICCFLLPSTIIFTSGIHKDSIVFLGLGLFLYNLKGSSKPTGNWKSLPGLALSFLLILLMRNYVAIMLLPFALAYFIAVKNNIAESKVFCGVIVVGCLLFFGWTFLIPSYNPITVIAKRQSQFLNLPQSNSQISLDTVYDLKSFVTALPRAGYNVMTKPMPGEFPNYFYTVLGIEQLIYLSIIVGGLIFYLKSPRKQISSTALFCLFFSCSILLIIGLITPNAGTIMRYRSLYLPLLLYPFLKQLCNIKNKNI